jgi:formylglycine-generating enzyme required for sulfatase activity
MYVVADNGTSVVRPPNERRVALVIGNNRYPHSALKNPINDAVAMKTTLQSLGFDVDIVTDASRAAMTTAIQRLGRKAQGVNTVALFFYSGHGLQVNNDNFLVPIDAVVQSEPDVEVACVSLNYLMRQLEQANSGTNIIVLDACRNNPFSYNKNSGGGLATPSRTPSGTYIAFATAPLTTALDGVGDNSPYTIALMKAIKTPNAKIEDAFKIVRREVKRIGQTPWDNSSLDGDFYFNPQQGAQPTPQYQPSTTRLAKENYTETNTEIYFKMIYIKNSTFEMGAENGSYDEIPIHKVQLEEFYMSKTEVTVGAYLEFCKETNSNWPIWLEIDNEYNVETGNNDKYKKKGYSRINNDNLPIVGVSWDNAVAYCKWLNKKSKQNYRLPTEAEWESVARGGLPLTSIEKEKQGRIRRLSSDELYKLDGNPEIVAQGEVNPYGFYDFLGNVSEWCSDWYSQNYYKTGNYQNPKGASIGEKRVVRGRNYYQDPDMSRIARRDSEQAGTRLENLGFRVVCDTQ